MAQDNLQHMADILPMTTPDPFVWHYYLIPVLLIVIGWLIWRYWQNPYIRLSRQLKQRVLSSRQVAHALAQLSIKNRQVRAQLDSLRFQRSSPDKQTLLSLIKRLQDES